MNVAFGLVLLLMSLMIGLVLWQLQAIHTSAHRLAEIDMAKADAAAELDAATRANVRRVMELLIVQSPDERAAVLKHIEDNKVHASQALAKLDKLLYLPQGRSLLQELQTARSAYVGEFSKVIELSGQGDVDAAKTHMHDHTLPAFDRVQEPLSRMVSLQRELVDRGARSTVTDAATARWEMLGAGAVAVVLGLCAAAWLTRSITEPIRQAVGVARRVASGDLTAEIQVDRSDEAGELLAALRDMNASLIDIVGQVRQGSECIATGSTQIAMGNTDLSQRTEQQASSLQETAASMEQLTGTVRQNADMATQANQLALSATASVREGSQAVGEAVSTMASIASASQRIAEITAVIDGLAFQTNLLALNASVEAARAGEQGRGFAVVADEVRHLAQRSAEAAREIKTLIGASVEQVEQGSRQVMHAGSRMDGIVNQVQKVADLVAEINAASGEQAGGIVQVGQAVSQLDQVTQQNAALVEESAAAAESLRQQAHKLAQVVQAFTLREGAWQPA